jgi:hypothetical protein
MGQNILPSSFIGVFSKDALPKQRKRNQMFIINTDASNLQGTHWVAVIVRNGKGYYFDSFGNPPPLMVNHWLHGHCDTWSSNTRQVQSPLSQQCGYFCLHYLYYASSSYLMHTRFDDMVNLLYPPQFTILTYEQTVVEFIKLNV